MSPCHVRVRCCTDNLVVPCITFMLAALWAWSHSEAADRVKYANWRSRALVGEALTCPQLGTVRPEFHQRYWIRFSPKQINWRSCGVRYYLDFFKGCSIVCRLFSSELWKNLIQLVNKVKVLKQQVMKSRKRMNWMNTNSHLILFCINRTLGNKHENMKKL